VYRPLAGAAGALAVLAASAVSAATAPAFVQPALKAAAAHPRPGSGAGSVGVKVFVSTAGTPGAVTINFTTNPADNAAALDFARRSTYLPALRDGRPFASVGVFLVQFSAAGSPVFLKLAASDAARTAAYEALSAKRYTRAETGLLAYLKTVPDDSRVREILAWTYGLDGRLDDALANFERAGEVTPLYRSYAAGLYVTRAGRELPANQTAAMRDLDRAAALAATARPRDRAPLLANVAAWDAYAGRFDRVAALRATVAGLDPSGAVDGGIANAISRRVADETAAHDNVAAVQTLEQAATLQPARAHAWLRQATFVLAAQADAGGSGWAAVRAEADKALALDTGDAMMAYLAGYALMETDDPVTARTYFRRAQDALKNGATAEDPSLAEKIADALKQTGEGN